VSVSCLFSKFCCLFSCRFVCFYLLASTLSLSTMSIGQITCVAALHFILAAILAQSAANCAVHASADLFLSEMAHSAAQPMGAKRRGSSPSPEHVPSSRESSPAGTEAPSDQSSSEETISFLCQLCLETVEVNDSQPLECGSCGKHFHFNCYNAHLPCGRVLAPMEADEVLMLPYAKQGRGMRRARGRDEHQLTRRVWVGQWE